MSGTFARPCAHDPSPADVIEAIVDELAMGELAQGFDGLRIDRVADGSLLLAYGTAGRFKLDVTQA